MGYTPRQLIAPSESYFLVGPPGAGKSTWLEATYPGAVRLDFLEGELERECMSYPEKIRALAMALAPHSVLILDEIQRVPRILPEIHGLIESGYQVQFVMSASSIVQLRQPESDLLGGRAAMVQLGPFIASELKEAFVLEKVLKTGLIPLIYYSPDPEEKLKNYINLYLKEEIQAEGLVRQIGDFARFLEIASFSHGSLWTSTDIGRESQVKRATVDNYLSILEDLFLAFTLPVFSRRAKRRLVAHPKFYFYDVGIYRALKPRGILDSNEEIEGIALEGLVAQHLKAWTQSQKEKHSLCFWRTHSGLEVDFVIYGPGGFFAIEVKRSPYLGPDDLRSLLAFKEEYPEAEVAIVTNASHREMVKGISVIPIREFLNGIVLSEPLKL